MLQIKCLAIDAGFGSVKIAYKNPSGQIERHKFTSAVGRLVGPSIVKDENAFSFEGGEYYLFDTALRMPSDKLIDLMSYEGLRDASPIIIRYLMLKYNIEPEYLVLGLSLTMMEFSADYKDYVARLLSFPKDRIRLVPQGVGGKVAYDNFMLDPTVTVTEAVNARSRNYLGVDIGYNTVDVVQVIDGQIYSGMIQGFEGAGIHKVSLRLIEEFLKIGMTLDIQDTKNIISTGNQVYRSQHFDRTQLVEALLVEYVSDLIKMIEEKFSATLNKMDNLLFFGGGGAIMKKYNSQLQQQLDTHFPVGYVMIPNLAEYYNVFGYLLIGSKIADSQTSK